MFNNLNLKLTERRLSNSKNMRTWNVNKKSSLRTTKSRTSSSKSMSSSTRHSLKVSLVSENNLSTGSPNTTRWKDNMLTFRVSLRKRRLFGKASSTSLRSKRSKPRRTTRTLSANSSKLLISFRDLRMRASQSTSTTTTLSSSSSSKSSRKS